MPQPHKSFESVQQANVIVWVHFFKWALCMIETESLFIYGHIIFIIVRVKENAAGSISYIKVTDNLYIAWWSLSASSSTKPMWRWGNRVRIFVVIGSVSSFILSFPISVTWLQEIANSISLQIWWLKLASASYPHRQTRTSKKKSVIYI